MNVVISIAEHELEMADRWFSWVCELGGTQNHHLYLIPTSGIDIKDIVPKSDKAFNHRVTIMIDYEGQTSDWQKTEPMRSASGPNSSFRQAAWHFYMNKIGPWFWCELDCIPTKKEWLDRLEEEYKVAVANGKKFMGAHVEIPSVPPHLTGNSVYPMNVPEEAPTLVQRTNWTPKGQEQEFELAFDIAGAQEVIPKSWFTNLIQHKFRFKGFESRAEFDSVIDTNAVVFHSDKKGTIYRYLRENLHGMGEAITGGNSTEPVPLQIRKEGDAICAIADHASQDATTTSAEASKQCTAQSTSKAAPTFKPEARPVPKGINDSTEPRQPQVENRTYTYEKVLQEALCIPENINPICEPWKNKTESEHEVRLLCAALATFAKSPIHKHRVRQALREAKIIK